MQADQIQQATVPIMPQNMQGLRPIRWDRGVQNKGPIARPTIAALIYLRYCRIRAVHRHLEKVTMERPLTE